MLRRLKIIIMRKTLIMNIKPFITAAFALLVLSSGAQQDLKEQALGIKFTGFVKTDYFFDSRETYNIREGHFLLYPREPLPDAQGTDLNAKSSFNFLSIQSRLGGRITGPDAFGAKTSGLLEADFFSNENANFYDQNGFRLRHAYVKLNWSKTEMLAGQTWHPLFSADCYPGVISFNTGAPFQPFSRNPQFRLTQQMGKLSVAMAVSSQLDITSPLGSQSLRYAGLPNTSLMLQYKSMNKETGKSWLAGAVADFKRLQPLLATTKSGLSYATDEKVDGLSFSAYGKLENPKFTAKVHAVYGQNLYDMVMLGGYAVHEVIDLARNTVSYTTLNNLSTWAEISTNGPRWQLGFFGGFARNLGSDKKILIYSNKVDGTATTVRGSTIHSVYRLSPRAVLKSGKLQFATEMELTSAAYAIKDSNGIISRDDFGKIADYEYVSNLRWLFAVFYAF